MSELEADPREVEDELDHREDHAPGDEPSTTVTRVRVLDSPPNACSILARSWCTDNDVVSTTRSAS